MDFSTDEEEFNMLLELAAEADANEDLAALESSIPGSDGEMSDEEEEKEKHKVSALAESDAPEPAPKKKKVSAPG